MAREYGVLVKSDGRVFFFDDEAWEQAGQPEDKQRYCTEARVDFDTYSEVRDLWKLLEKFGGTIDIAPDVAERVRKQLVGLLIETEQNRSEELKTVLRRYLAMNSLDGNNERQAMRQRLRELVGIGCSENDTVER